MDAVMRISRAAQSGIRRLVPLPPIAWLLLGYFLCLAPHAHRYVKHHPDERHYTDAAMRMVHSGDYLTPRTQNGELRLKKPILTYWLAAASYRLLGISTFSSRLPFLLLGLGAVWLTYRLAWFTFGDRRTGLIAGLIVSCQPALLISSPRSIPDIVLAFFLLLSAYGFAQLMRADSAKWRFIWIAYLGAGLAIEAKGLPAVVFVAYAIACLICLRSATFRTEWIRHLVGITGCAVVGGGWFVLMYWLHGSALLNQFFGDAVIHRVNRDWWGIVFDLPQVLLVLIACLLPWSGSLVDAARQWYSRRGRVIPRDPVCLMFTGWILIFLLLASSVNRVNVRYQTPIVPLVAVLSAGALAELDKQRLRLWFCRLGRVAVSVVATLGIAAAMVCLIRDQAVLVGIACGLLVCGWSVGYMSWVSRMSWQHVGLGAVLTLLLLSPVTYVAVRGITKHSLEERLLVAIDQLNGGHHPITFVTQPAFPSRVRVISGGETDVSWLGYHLSGLQDRRDAFERRGVLVLNESDAQRLDRSAFEVALVENGFQELQVGDLVRSLMRGELGAYLEQHRSHLALAVPRPVTVRQPIYVAHEPGASAVR